MAWAVALSWKGKELPGTETIPRVLQGSCNISAHSSAFPQRFMWLRKLPSKCLFLHTLSSQNKLMRYVEVGFRTEKINHFRTEKIALHKKVWSSRQFGFFNYSPPAGRNISALQYKRMWGKVHLRNRNYYNFQKITITFQTPVIPQITSFSDFLSLK